MRRRLLILGAAAGVFLLAPAAAWADPATPTNYRSRVTSSPDGVEASTLGGDAFVRVRAARGHEVVVLGYADEPWLRIRTDGTVEENGRSPARYLNQDRYADVDLPDSVDPGAEPEWRRVGDGGEWTWHDHRIHWMSPDLPPVVHAAGGESTRVLTWRLALLLDGEETAVWGTLVWLPDERVVPWLASGLLAGLAVAIAGRRHAKALTPFLVGAASISLVLAYGEVSGQPAGAGGKSSPLVLAGMAFVLALASLVAHGRWPSRARNLALGSLATLMPWVAIRLEVFTEPVLPTSLPAWIDRVGTATVLWVVAGGVAIVANRFVRASRKVLGDEGATC